MGMVNSLKWKYSPYFCSLFEESLFFFFILIAPSHDLPETVMCTPCFSVHTLSVFLLGAVNGAWTVTELLILLQDGMQLNHHYL